MGKKNKVVKLTDRKIRYIIRAKKRGDSTKRIAEDMKLSLSSVKRVWMHWTKTKMPLNIKKFGRKKKTLHEESVKLILEVHKEQNLGARRLERIIDFTHGKHTSIHDGKKAFVCVVLDDSSRRILVGGEFDADSRFEDFFRRIK